MFDNERSYIDYSLYKSIYLVYDIAPQKTKAPQTAPPPNTH
ncbi:hypothetical protein BVRB_3g050820 [Beta vulgaris subsp. vulgaris]|uniref:Uncharacterized protein n=1 Tax=Beta vulgaris subsp. vulgaris TaxID=3555 RepID=A0A0J8CS83_BETVV|nr:hypothetical protein BVRB_3g050820 [Beta vulgaris subsp. vulgaris]